MRKIPVAELKEGMSFDDTVFIEDNMVFIPPRIPIRKADLDKLKKWGVEAVETDGQEVIKSHEVSQNRKEKWGNIIETELEDLYNSYLERFESILSNIQTSNNVDATSIKKLTSDILKDTKEKGIGLTRFVLSHAEKERSFAKGAVDSALIAVAIAQALKRPDESIEKTILSALLHDIGMLEVDDSIINKTGSLNEDEINKIRSHPVYSYQAIKNVLGLSEDVAQIAFQHHERWDGGGYPQGLTGEEIRYESRILSVADAFEAMLNVRSYRNSMIGYDAIKNILSDNSRRFDPSILKAFIRNVGIYPLGSLVMLNNSAIGRVIEINNKAPLRPVVKVLIDETGKEYKDNSGKLIDLIDAKNVYIARAINANELNSASGNAS